MKQQFTTYDLQSTIEYRELGFQIVTCPVCGMETLDHHWVCCSCGWEYDGITDDRLYSACNRAAPAAYRQANQVHPAVDTAKNKQK